MISDLIIQFLEEISKKHFDNSSEFLNYCIEKMILITKSEIGYFYYYDETSEKFTLHAWSKAVMNKCNMINAKTQYDLKDTGCWGDVVRERREFIINDYKNYTKAKGTPEGHVSLKNLLMIPIFEDAKIVATMGLANKNEDYTSIDLKIVKSFGIFLWYLYELKQKEEKLQTMIHEKEILMKEIFHRVKNSLQLTTSLLSIPMSSMEDKNYLNLFENAISRIQVVAITMENIYKSASDAQYVMLKEYCIDIIDSCMTDSINIVYHIDDLKLASKYSTSFGLILNELITNSIKHAFSNIKDPSINIDIRHSNNEITLIYKDNGNGISADAKEGLGSLIITSLIEQIEGKVFIKNNNGYNLSLSFKII